MNNVLAKVVDWVIVLTGHIAFDTFKNTSRLNSWRVFCPMVISPQSLRPNEK